MTCNIITINPDDDLIKKLRIIQSKMISKLTEYVGFSRLVHEGLQ